MRVLEQLPVNLKSNVTKIEYDFLLANYKPNYLHLTMFELEFMLYTLHSFKLRPDTCPTFRA